MSDYRFTTDTPPKGGSCSITPTSGKALVTDFTVSCHGYKDTHLPLDYSIYQKQNGKSMC